MVASTPADIASIISALPKTRGDAHRAAIAALGAEVKGVVNGPAGTTLRVSVKSGAVFEMHVATSQRGNFYVKAVVPVADTLPAGTTYNNLLLTVLILQDHGLVLYTGSSSEPAGAARVASTGIASAAQVGTSRVTGKTQRDLLAEILARQDRTDAALSAVRADVSHVKDELGMK